MGRGGDDGPSDAERLQQAQAEKAQLRQEAEQKAAQQQQQHQAAMMEMQQRIATAQQSSEKQMLRLQQEQMERDRKREEKVAAREMERMERERERERQQFQEAAAERAAMQAEFLRQLKEAREDPEKDARIKKMEEEITKYQQLKEEELGKTYEEAEATQWERFIQSCKGMEVVPKRPKPALAMLGRRGVGKSSFCNAFAGSVVAQSGERDTTKEISKVSDHPVELWDVPGETDLRSYANLQTVMQMKQMHAIVILYVDGVANCLKIASLCCSLGIPTVVVRNKCDSSFTRRAAERAQKPLQEHIQDTYHAEKQEMFNHLKVEVPFFYVACDPENPDAMPEEFAFGKLKETLHKILQITG